jgi:hypothetical protein
MLSCNLTLLTRYLYLTHYLLNRGLSEEDFDKVADFFDRAVTITQDISKQVSLCRYLRCVYVYSTIKAT